MKVQMHKPIVSIFGATLGFELLSQPNTFYCILGAGLLVLTCWYVYSQIVLPLFHGVKK